jgi:DNA-binding transcriptional LysR family regulator
MTINDLATFVDVVRLGSFAAAARRRDVDPSSVSRTIAALEETLGVRLFARTTRALTTTEAGRVYHERVEPLIDELERAAHAARDTRESPRGLLRVSSFVSFGQRNLVPLLPEFARRYPELTFDLLLTDVALDLVAERIDVALRIGPLVDSTLVGHRLAPLRAMLCASPDYLERNGVPSHPREIAAHSTLALGSMPGFDGVWRFARGKEQIDVALAPLLRSSNAQALTACATAGMGLTVQADWIVGHELNSGALRHVLADWQVVVTDFDGPAVWALYPSRTYLPLKVRAFVSFLEEQYRESPPWHYRAGTA